MNMKRAMAIVAILAVAITLAPFVSTDSDAMTEEDVVVITADGKEVSIDLDSGESKTVKLYVTNNTTDDLSLTVSVKELHKDLTCTTEVLVDNPLGLIEGADSGNNKALVNVTFTAEQYADTTSTVALIVLNFVDVESQETIVKTEVAKVGITSTFTSGDSYNKFFGIFPNTLGEPLNSAGVTAVITFILWIVLTILVAEIVIPLLTRLVGTRKTDSEKKSLTKRLTTTITALMIVMAVNECAQIMGLDSELVHGIAALSSVIYVLLTATIAWQVYLFIVTAFLRGVDEKVDLDGMDMSLLPLFKMIGKVGIGLFVVVAVLGAFGVDLAGILVSAGVVTLGITLGAQNTLNQFFSGVVLLATRPFKKGDFVMINNTTYIVRKVKLMYTEFLNWDKDQVVTIPNNTVSSATLVNLTKEYHGTRVFAFVDVAYDSDLELVKRCLEAAGMKHPHVIKDGSRTPPSARLVGFGGSGISFRLACYVDDYDDSSHYCGQIRELIFNEFRDAGVEIPFNRIQVDILSDVEDNRKSGSSA